MNYALKIDQLTVHYEKTPVLWDISLEVPQGKLVAIVGPNGAGKSTLIKAALGLVKPISGTVSFFGFPLKKMIKKVAYVPQRESVDWNFPITLIDLVLMGCYGHLGLFRRPSKKDKERATELLSQVGLADFKDRQISQLSGGQQQRAFIVRALMQQADLYFMDEPFSGIDVSSTKVILALLHTLKAQGKSIFIVHHDLDSVKSTFDWVILLNMCIVSVGEVSQVFTPELIQRAFGKESKIFDQANKIQQEKAKGFLYEG